MTDLEHDTWEPMQNLGHAQELLDEYLHGAPSMWQGHAEPLLWSSMEFGAHMEVLANGEWRPAIVTAVHTDTRTVCVRTSPDGEPAKSRQVKIDKRTWLRKPTAS